MTLPTFTITQNTTPLERGDRIQCIACKGAKYPHTGTVIIAEPGARNVIVQYDDRQFTETMPRTALERETKKVVFT